MGCWSDFRMQQKGIVIVRAVDGLRLFTPECLTPVWMHDEAYDSSLTALVDDNVHLQGDQTSVSGMVNKK